MSGWLKGEPAPPIHANDARDKLARPLRATEVPVPLAERCDAKPVPWP
jgi:hypothetical protein